MPATSQPLWALIIRVHWMKRHASLDITLVYVHRKLSVVFFVRVVGPQRLATVGRTPLLLRGLTEMKKAP